MVMPTFLSYPTFDDPRTQVQLATWTGMLRVNPDPQRIFSQFSAAFPGNFISGTVPFGPRNTYTQWFKWPGFYLVLAGGTVGLTHLPKLIQGWANPIADVTNFGASDAFADSAYGVYSGIGDANMSDGFTWILAGHSYGGAQLAAFAAIVKDRLPRSTIYGFSYGAPRPGQASLQDRSTGWTWVRWFNDTDPVTRVPPHTNEGAILATVMPDDVQLGCNRQVQIVAGRQILPDGTWQEQELNSFPLLFTELSLASWIAGSSCFGATAHAVDEYVRRFGLMAPSRPRVETVRPRAVVDDHPLVTTSRERAQMVSAAVQNLGGAPFPPANISFAPPKPRDRYKIKKESGTWMVYLNADPFCIGGSKRQARKIARAGNRQIAAIPPPGIIAS